MTSNKLSELATTISQNVSILVDELHKRNALLPSFQQNGFNRYPGDESVQAPRQALIEAAMDLYHLAIGPGEYIKNQALLLNHDRTTLEVLNHFDVFKAVPLDGSATYEEIAIRTGIPVDIARRYLRYAFTLRIFEERDGRVHHTAASAEGATSKYLKSWVGHCTEDMSPSSIHEVEAINRYGDGSDVTTAAWALTFYPNEKNGWKTIFDQMANEGEGENKGWKERRFGEAMAYYTADSGFQTSNIHNCFDWDSLGDATICDVGGSTGHLSFELASKHLKLKMVVQDYAGLKKQFDATRPVELADRVSFQAHVFFTAQPVKGGHYLLKHVLHDWPDKRCIDIIRNLLPSMGPHSKIFIVDGVFPKHGTLPYCLERFLTALDLQMELAVRGKERSVEQWTELFKAADPDLKVNSITQPQDCAYALVEVVKTTS